MRVLLKFAVPALVVGGAFHLMLATEAASMLVECLNGGCDPAEAVPIAAQAVIVAAAGGALIVAAYLLVRSGKPVAPLVVWTTPAFLFHLVVVFLDPDESVFLPLVTAIAPLIAAISLLWCAATVRGGSRDDASTDKYHSFAQR